METPKNTRQFNRVRTPTPRLSERKKKLFIKEKNDDIPETSVSEDQTIENMMDGIEPLELQQSNKLHTPKKLRSIEFLLKGTPHDNKPMAISFLDDEEDDENKTDSYNSSKSNLRVRNNNNKCSTMNKENDVTDDEQLPHLFNKSMQIEKQTSDKQQASAAKASTTITGKKTKLNAQRIEDDNDDDIDMGATPAKRRCDETPNAAANLSPTSKGAKTESFISTKAFYSNTERSPRKYISYKMPRYLPEKRISTPRTNRKSKEDINKGVSHKIRKPKRGSHNSRNTHSFPPVNVDLILNQMQNEKLRNLITSKREERKKAEEVHDILRNARDPIQMARPLSLFNDTNDDNNNTSKAKKSLIYDNDDDYNDDDADFSDLDSDELETRANSLLFDSESSDDEMITTANSKRKFFKSGRNHSKQMKVTITNNISAKVCNGKISLAEPKKTKRKHKYKDYNSSFSAEQATVDNILQRLNDSSYGDTNDKEVNSSPQNKIAGTNASLEETPAKHQSNETSSLPVDEFEEFRKRIPYKTTNQALIDRQNCLLEFLIQYKICNEENFHIFIADPDNNRDAAERVINEIVVVQKQENLEFRNRLPYKTTNPILIEQQECFLDFLIDNDICTEENFDIFIANYDQRHNEAEAIILSINQTMTPKPTPKKAIVIETEQNNIEHPQAMNVEDIEESNIDSESDKQPVVEQEKPEQEEPEQSVTKQNLFPIFTQNLQPLKIQKSQRTKAPKIFRSAFGSNQYQIDAGQKEFGARQCKQCGLVYTIHEPEEEELHREYHSSLHLLRFKGWIDEDAVALYTEWANDGRIIRLTSQSSPKRLDRLWDILKIVDKELGYSNYIVPKTFTAYFAIRKSQIVGVCLVQPIHKANKFMQIDGIEYCSEEEYDAKCGISRIWVAPLHRRMYIASRLIEAVQHNTIPGENIPINMIAFSAPSDDGRLLAQKLNDSENFLVYQ